MQRTSNKASMNGERNPEPVLPKTMGAWSKRMGKRIKADTSLPICIYDLRFDFG